MNRAERIAEVKRLLPPIIKQVLVTFVPLWACGAIGGMFWRQGDHFMGIAAIAIGLIAWWKWVGVW